MGFSPLLTGVKQQSWIYCQNLTMNGSPSAPTLYKQAFFLLTKRNISLGAVQLSVGKFWPRKLTIISLTSLCLIPAPFGWPECGNGRFQGSWNVSPNLLPTTVFLRGTTLPKQVSWALESVHFVDQRRRMLYIFSSYVPRPLVFGRRSLLCSILTTLWTKPPSFCVYNFGPRTTDYTGPHLWISFGQTHEIRMHASLTTLSWIWGKLPSELLSISWRLDLSLLAEKRVTGLSKIWDIIFQEFSIGLEVLVLTCMLRYLPFGDS